MHSSAMDEICNLPGNRLARTSASQIVFFSVVLPNCTGVRGSKATRETCMSGTDKLFAGSIPENYDGNMVPLIFASYAEDLAQKAAALSPKAVLETAAGSGAVTRALAPKLAVDARY